MRTCVRFINKLIGFLQIGKQYIKILDIGLVIFHVIDMIILFVKK